MAEIKGLQKSTDDIRSILKQVDEMSEEELQADQLTPEELEKRWEKNLKNKKKGEPQLTPKMKYKAIIRTISIEYDNTEDKPFKEVCQILIKDTKEVLANIIDEIESVIEIELST